MTFGKNNLNEYALPLPDWLPKPVIHYLQHTVQGRSIRALARGNDVHPSTISRQVRKIEGLRDDPLIDAALRRLEAGDGLSMKTHDLLPVMRKMAVMGTVLVAGHDMSRAVLLREGLDGKTVQLGSVDAVVAQNLAMRHWIKGERLRKVARYRLSELGRITLDKHPAPKGFAEGQAGFAGRDDQAEDQRPWRYGAPESPVALLARRRGVDGDVFLPTELLVTAERVQEDYELARLNQTDFFSLDDVQRARAIGVAQRRSLQRLQGALAHWGPDLGAIVLRCCCQLQGLAQTEKELGWPARSGKLVLRIALERLRDYHEQMGEAAGIVG